MITPARGAAVNLVDVDPDSWFAQLSWVPQRPLLVPGTLADNLRLVAPQATDDELDRAARAGGLEPVVSGLPHGWSTRIGHGGLGLSAGQRQRLALARALLRPAALFVFDEPTAHLDTATEQVVLAALDRLRREHRTVVLVAHRPAVTAVADQVITVADAPAVAPVTPALDQRSADVALVAAP